jgi:hypothetical protein
MTYKRNLERARMAWAMKLVSAQRKKELRAANDERKKLARVLARAALTADLSGRPAPSEI